MTLDRPNLLDMCRLGGCGSKMPSSQLESILTFLGGSPRGAEVIDDFGDAAVFRTAHGDLTVATVDFGTPVSDDPTEWGMISAQNALSDVYAVGGRPLMAMSILGWPRTDTSAGSVVDVVRGAQSVVDDAGAQIVGGHSLSSDVPFFGLAVIGTVSEASVMGNSRGRPGDFLLLTKPLGSGMAIAMRKARLVSEESWTEATAWMVRSNREASELAVAEGVQLSTDITGFGLLGHAHLIGQRSGTAVELWPDAVPKLSAASEAFAVGHIPPTTEDQMIRAEAFCSGPTPSLEKRLVLSDPQTSGGLLIGVPAESVSRIKGQLLNSAVVGRLVDGPAGRVSFRDQESDLG